MATVVNTGMSKAEMKKLLIRSKEEPVSCAVGIGDDQAYGLLLLHKIKRGKALETALKDDFPKAKSLRFGTAFVDVDDNPKLVRLTLNRAAPGIARKLIKTLKGTGFNKVIIQSEDGETELYEEAEDEPIEGEAPAGAPAGAEAIASGTIAEPPPAPPPPPAAATPADRAAQTAALVKLLASLAPGIPKAAGNDEARKAMLMKFATLANVNIKTGNLATAAQALADLKQEMEGTTAGATNQVLAKTRMAWTGTQRKVTSEVDKLRAALAGAYAGEAFLGEMMTRFETVAGSVMDHFDDRLGDAIDSVMAETDENQRDTLVTDTRALMKDTLAFVEADETIAEFDANPFVPLAIRSTVAATLGALAKSIH